ncbi:MAG: ATP-binding cassette domain-containing protein [Pseudomonadota bacterium]
MAPLLTLTDARLAFGSRVLFDDLALTLDEGSRIALVGRNGAGKSTLLQTLAGRIELDQGERATGPRTRLAYLPQAPSFDGAVVAREWLCRADGEAPTGVAAHVADAMLGQLDLDGDAPPATLSGGQQRRLALARTLVVDADALLLDEPTNHLDIDTIRWLEERLASTRQAVVLISHDRAFLDRVATRCWWLDRGRIRALDVPFRELDAAIDDALAIEAKTTAKLEKRIATETAWSRAGITARRKRNQGRLRKLHELRAERARLIGHGGKAKLETGEATPSGTLAIEAEAITKSFDGRCVVPAFSTRVLRGDRIGIVGPNGAGKSTLLDLLTGRRRPDAGSITHGTNLRTEFFAQDRSDLDLERTPWEVLCPTGGDQVDVRGQPRHVMGYLKDFLFDEAQARAPCRALSGGERNRLLLAGILARPANLLVLDEPTNDLDMETLDVLVDALDGYGGTLLVVSHDRDFLDRVATSVIAFEAGPRLIEYAGGYTDMVAQRASTVVDDVPARALARPETPAKRGFTTPGKERQRQERAVQKAEREVETLHAAIAAIEAQLGDATLYGRDPNLAARLAEELENLRRQETEAEARWLTLASAL